MAEALDTWGILSQNLIDAGCGEEMTRHCVRLAQDGKAADMLRLLSRHRKALLDAVHLNQKQIDCLDYLVYQTEKEQRLEE